MCQPKSEGGRRCAAHTRPNYLAALSRIDNCETWHARQAAQVDTMADIARHAATPSGGREVQQRRDEAHQAGDYATVGFLDACSRIGSEMRKNFDAIERDITNRVDCPR